MKHLGVKLAGVMLATSVLGVGAVATADNGRRSLSARLSGYEEVPALSTPGQGEFRGRINRAGDEVEWELSFGDLGSAVTQAHIHFENATNNGSIVTFLCTNLGNGPAGTQTCPAAGGTISGTIRASDIGNGAAPQGLAAGEMAEFVAALRSGATYVNVHSELRPGGEIRAQLEGHHHHF
jgi:CHRD domain